MTTLRQRINGFLWYFQKKYACPICNYPTLSERNLYDICYVCYWEDAMDYQYDDERSACNHGLTVNIAKKNFQQFGACARRLKKYCRPYRWWRQ